MYCGHVSNYQASKNRWQHNIKPLVMYESAALLNEAPISLCKWTVNLRTFSKPVRNNCITQSKASVFSNHIIVMRGATLRATVSAGAREGKTSSGTITRTSYIWLVVSKGGRARRAKNPLLASYCLNELNGTQSFPAPQRNILMSSPYYAHEGRTKLKKCCTVVVLTLSYLLLCFTSAFNQKQLGETH